MSSVGSIYSQIATPVNPDAVIAPGTLTDERVIRGAGGKEIQDSGVTLNDSNVMSGFKAILNAGTATAGTTPLKFTAGPVVTLPEVGAVEYLAEGFLGTDGSSVRGYFSRGPTTVSDNFVPRWDGATGSKMQSSLLRVGDDGRADITASSSGTHTFTIQNTGTGASEIISEAVAGAASRITLKNTSAGANDWVLSRLATSNTFQIDLSGTVVFATTTSFDSRFYAGNLNVERTAASSTVELNIINGSATAGAARLAIQSQLGGGNPYIQWALPSGVTPIYFCMGIDNADSDIFKFTGGTTLASSPTIWQTDETVFEHKVGVSYPRRASGAANLTGTVQDYILAVTDVAAPRTVSLPDTGVKTGQIFIIKDETGAGTGNITLDVTGGVKTIDGALTMPITNYGSARVYYNGTNYFTF